MNQAVEHEISEGGFVEQLHRETSALIDRLHCDSTLDVNFLGYLRHFARFGYFTLGPITIDVNVIEAIVERTAVPVERGYGVADDYVRFTRLLMQEVRRSGRKRVDELHYLMAFMKCHEGLPGRVFGELGVKPQEVEAYLKQTGGGVSEPLERLMSPEEVAEYLRVNVQTVRAWIRSGKLPARRIAGLRALRVRYADVVELLRPIDE